MSGPEDMPTAHRAAEFSPAPDSATSLTMTGKLTFIHAADIHLDSPTR
jgi:hypothetical protein